MALLVAAVAVAEALPVGSRRGRPGRAPRRGRRRRHADFAAWKPAARRHARLRRPGRSPCNRALLGEKRRLSRDPGRARPAALRDRPARGRRPAETVRPDTARLRPGQVSEEGRRARQLDRAAELDEALRRLVAWPAHALQRPRGPLLRRGPRRESRPACAPRRARRLLVPDGAVPLASDPFAFVLDRNAVLLRHRLQAPALGAALLQGRGEGRLAAGGAGAHGRRRPGVLVADRLEIQSFTGSEPELLEAFAALAADAILQTRASARREEMAPSSRPSTRSPQKLATLTREPEVREPAAALGAEPDRPRRRGGGDDRRAR